MGAVLASLALAGCEMVDKAEPVDLIMWRAAGPDVFEGAPPVLSPRLFSIEAAKASTTLHGCERSDWVQTGERIQPSFVVGSGRTLDFACTSEEVTILAEVVVDPWLGMDGVIFAACRPENCPPPEVAFRHDLPN